MTTTDCCGGNSNKIYTNTKICYSSSEIKFIYLENALTTDGSTITNTVAMRWTTAVNFSSDTVTEM